MVMANSVKKKSKGKKVSDDFPPGMAPKMLNMLQAVEKLEESLEPLISKPHHEVLAKMNPLDKAKIGMLEAYTVNSLFWVLMKTSKEEVESSLRDDYKLEMGRLKEIQRQIAQIEARANRPLVNTNVASRLIRRGIGKPTRENRDQEDETRAKRVKNEQKPDDCESEDFKSSWQ